MHKSIHTVEDTDPTLCLMAGPAPAQIQNTKKNGRVGRKELEDMRYIRNKSNKRTINFPFFIRLHLFLAQRRYVVARSHATYQQQRGKGVLKVKS